MNQKHLIETLFKITIIYFSILGLFYKFNNNNTRLSGTITIYILASYFFNIHYQIALFYLLLGIACAVSEHLVSTMKNTWIYKNPDIGNVPYWLIPLWGNAILVAIELTKISSNYIPISVSQMPI